MPAHNRLRPNDRHRIEHTRYEPVEPYEDKAVEPAEGRALMATPTQQYIQLMTKRYHLCLKRLSRPEEVDDIHLSRFRSSNTRSSWPDWTLTPSGSERGARAQTGSSGRR